MVMLNNFNQRRSLALQMQPIAIKKIYSKLWPGAKIHQGDIAPDSLSQFLDRVGNTDKTIITQYAVIQVAQRIRQSDVWDRWPELTLREKEYWRMKNALDIGGMLPGFYAYGYATETMDDFLRFFVIRFADWFAFIHSDRATPQQKLRFKDREGRAENFFYIAWANIPKEFIVVRYVFGLPVDIQPVTRKNDPPIQLSLC